MPEMNTTNTVTTSDLKRCPFCGAHGAKQKGSSANIHIFEHEKDCFLSAYMRIQDYQFDAWNQRKKGYV
jgi:hypothetical protein